MDHAVIPAPARFDSDGGRGFAFRPGTVVAYADPGIAPVAGRFCAQIARRTGLRLVPVRGGGPAPAEPSVTVELAATAELAGLPATAGLSPGGGDPVGERYSLVIEEGQVVVRAAEPAGVARGLTTLLQLVASGTEELVVPCTRILDAPRYAWRGLSLDVARTFFTLEEIRRVIDLLELYKLNVLHLHLTDDQAWRLPWAAGRQPRAGRRLLPRRGPAGAGRLRRGPLRHHRSRDRHARAHRRAAAAAPGPEHRPQRGRATRSCPATSGTRCGSTRSCPRPSS